MVEAFIKIIKRDYAKVTPRPDAASALRHLSFFNSMARAPTAQVEDRRRVCRERKTLVGERVTHGKGLLFARGIFGYEPLRKSRRERLGGAANRRRPAAAGVPEGADYPRAGSARAFGCRARQPRHAGGAKSRRSGSRAWQQPPHCYAETVGHPRIQDQKLIERSVRRSQIVPIDVQSAGALSSCREPRVAGRVVSQEKTQRFGCNDCRASRRDQQIHVKTRHGQSGGNGQ
jgi:hypothetical protein